MSYKGPPRPLSRGFGDKPSCEDIAVSQYMNELITKAAWNNESELPTSSCSKLLKNKMAKSQNHRQTRMRSAAPSKRVIANWVSVQHEEENVDDNESTDKSSIDSTPRPASAPVRHNHPNQRSSLLSVSSSDLNNSYYSSSDVSSTRGTARRKPLYKQKSKVLCLRAFLNGDREKYARVTAPNFKQLLEQCTAKLDMVSAARKIYLSDGTLVKGLEQIKNNSDIYISSGESFKDPFGKYKEKEKLGCLSTWTMNGILFPQSKTRGKTKPSLSQRMMSLVEKQKRRILVFTNGDYINGKEVVTGRYDEFLDDCAKKLCLDFEAKGLFNWDGKEIGNFSEVPVIDGVLQPTTNTVIGPLWVTRGGEQFSFKGPFGFVTTLLETTKERLKEAKDYENQLELRHGGSDMTISVEVMSFTNLEIQSELQQIRRQIMELDTVILKLKSRKKQLRMKKREEEMTSSSNSSFKFQNITEIEENSGLLGKKGIRLKVYENGKINDEIIIYFNIHEASKGIPNDPKMLMSRLLDTITAHRKVLKHGPAGRSVAKKIFRDNGDEVVNVHELNTDDCIWLSFGEPFKSPYSYALHLVVDKTKSLSLWNEIKIIQREPLNDDVYDKQKGSLWKVINGYPTDNNAQQINFDNEPSQRVAFAKGLQPSQIQDTNTFLQFKKDPDLILYPELSVEIKLSKGDNSVWPSDCQKWTIAQDGLICSRSFSQLCLSTTELKVKVNYSEGTTLEGWIVKLAKRNISNSNQIWRFTPSGDICNLADPTFVLSWIANENVTLIDNDNMQEIPQVVDKLSEHPEKDNEEITEHVVQTLTTMKLLFGGEKYSVALLPKLPWKHQAIGTQRWALKQESFNNIGQWKYSQVSNPEWNRRALSWPVKQDGTINEDFKWPMEGCLICNAPAMKRRDTSSVGPPVRLHVRKNGETESRRTVTVIGPDLSNMARDTRAISHSNNTRKSSSTLSSSPSDMRSLELNLELVSNVFYQQCVAIVNVFDDACRQFLDRCTQALQLPFAARRLFDESGNELFTLSGIERNQLVFVSCGEAWLDYKTSHSEQQRRIIMTNLASDVAKLKQYCKLRNPEGLVLGVSGPVSLGSKICVTQLIEKENFVEQNKSENREMNEDENNDSLDGVRNKLLSSHERAHVKSEERLKSLQWPWETAITTRGEISVEDKQHGDFEHDVVYSNHRLNKRFRQQSVKNTSAAENSLLSCQWLYKDEFLCLRGNHQLVLAVDSVSSEDKIINEVVLCKKKLDDENQRWIIGDNGSVNLRSNSELLLTVSGPSMDSGSHHDNYKRYSVLVMPRKPCNGNANQLWSYNTNTGLFFSFAADTVNKEITAANKAGICTYAVLGTKKIPQTGYVLQDKTFLCDACGKSLRGKLRLQKVHENQSFSCAMGGADKPNKSACFKCLSNKVDMTSDEAEATLGMWEEQLTRLKKISTVRLLNKEIQAAQSVPAVRIRAYRNGEGSRSEPVLIVGCTVDSLLVQCTSRLGLTTAARRLYCVNGVQITDINQLRNTSCTLNISTQEKHSKTNCDQKSDKQDPIDTVYTANQRTGKNTDKAHVNVVEKTKSPVHLSDHSNQNESRPATDVFVSCGEPFVPLQEIDKQYLLQRKHQHQRTWVEQHLETEKHVLRQIQGRRIAARQSTEISPGEAVSWEDLEKLEENKQENIGELTEHLKDLKSKQQVEKEKMIPTKSNTRILTNTRLYDGGKTVRINVYENGDFEKSGVSVCGSSFLEIMNVSTSRLGLSAAVRRIFTKTGQEVCDISELIKGDNYCVSCGENFIPPTERQGTVERKATWSRLNRLSGGAMAYQSSQISQNLTLALTGPPPYQIGHR